MALQLGRGRHVGEYPLVIAHIFDVTHPDTQGKGFFGGLGGREGPAQPPDFSFAQTWG